MAARIRDASSAMAVRRCLLVAPLVAAALLAACESPNPVLYAIQPIPGATRSIGSRIVLLRSVGLARYLDRPQIVRSAENYRLDISANDWWGEPLGPMLSRVLVEELSQRLPGSTVFDGDSAITIESDMTVEINLRRLDASRTGEVVLDAQIAVTRRNPRRPPATRRFSVSVPQASPDMDGFVAAASIAVGRLADAVAGELRP